MATPTTPARRRPPSGRRGRMNPAPLLTGLLAGVLLTFGAGLTGAVAHSQLESSRPAQGSTVTELPRTAVLRFNEPIIPRGSAFTLTDRTRQAPRRLSATIRGASATLRLPAQVAPGPVTINYRIVSADGHPVTGALRFTLAG